ncbi:Rap1-interacting factor 1 N terminal-domain-containing protein [Dipodascopsis uninucleata]
MLPEISSQRQDSDMSSIQGRDQADSKDESKLRNQENNPPSSPLVKIKKRVNFSDSPFVPAFSSPVANNGSSPFKGGGTPTRSILKSRSTAGNSLGTIDSTSTAVSFDLASYPSFSAMLQTMCVALSANDSSTKLDIYVTLNQILRAYKSYPDANSLVEKIPTLVSYVKRDIEFPMDRLDGCGSRVMNQALKLMAFLASIDPFINVIDSDIASWLLTFSVNAIESSDIKKGLLLCHLSFLSSQRFPSRIFTPDLAARTLACVNKLRERSRSIESHSFRVYETLLILCPSLMLQRSVDWLPRTLQACFDENSSLHSNAIGPILIATRRFFGSQEFSLAVHDVLEARKEENSLSLIEEAMEKIEILFRERHESHVILLWETIIVLLMAWGKRREERLEKWPYLNRWLSIIRRCLNSTDPSVKTQAIYSWQKLAYAWFTTSLIVGADTNSEVLKRRTSILLSVFKFFGDSKSEILTALTDTFVKILYLSLKPGVTNTQIIVRLCDFTWTKLVVPVVCENCFLRPSTFSIGTGLLQNLLPANSGKSVQLRNAQEICFANIPPLHMPKLNSKWIRSRTDLILETLTVMFQKTTSEKEKEQAMLVWNSFLKSIQNLTQREVRPSAESVEAIASICNFIKNASKNSVIKPEIFKSLMISTMETFGVMSFAEKPFATDDYDNFIPIGSPSSKQSERIYGFHANSPLLRLLRLFVLSPTTKVEDSEQYYDAINEIVDYTLSSFRSEQKCLNFIGACLSILDNCLQQSYNEVKTDDSVFIHVPDKMANLWLIMANFTMNRIGHLGTGRRDHNELDVDYQKQETEIIRSIIDYGYRLGTESDLTIVVSACISKCSGIPVQDLIYDAFLKFNDKAPLANSCRLLEIHSKYLLRLDAQGIENENASEIITLITKALTIAVFTNNQSFDSKALLKRARELCQSLNQSQYRNLLNIYLKSVTEWLQKVENEHDVLIEVIETYAIIGSHILDECCKHQDLFPTCLNIIKLFLRNNNLGIVRIGMSRYNKLTQGTLLKMDFAEKELRDNLDELSEANSIAKCKFSVYCEEKSNSATEDVVDQTISSISGEHVQTLTPSSTPSSSPNKSLILQTSVMMEQLDCVDCKETKLQGILNPVSLIPEIQRLPTPDNESPSNSCTISESLGISGKSSDVIVELQTGYVGAHDMDTLDLNRLPEPARGHEQLADISGKSTVVNGFEIEISSQDSNVSEMNEEPLLPKSKGRRKNKKRSIARVTNASEFTESRISAENYKQVATRGPASGTRKKKKLSLLEESASSAFNVNIDSEEDDHMNDCIVVDITPRRGSGRTVNRRGAFTKADPSSKVATATASHGSTRSRKRKYISDNITDEEELRRKFWRPKHWLLLS